MRRNSEREHISDLAWEIQDRERSYRELLDAQGDVIFRLDAEGRVTFANKACRRVFGDAAEAISALLGDGRTCREVRAETSRGPRWFEVEDVQPNVGHRGIERQIVARDITVKREQAAQLEEARAAADAANKAKSRFLAAMSHEIRTPMNGILGMSGLLSETALSDEQRTYVGATDQSARTLLALIDEILDFSKIEAGRLDLVEADFGVETSVAGIVELLAPRAHEKGLDIAWAIDPNVPAMVRGDELRLKQIITNLAGNAVKFTDRGGVMITVERDRRLGPRRNASNAAPTGPAVTAHFEPCVTLVITVTDTGVGIGPDALSRLFAEFERGDEDVARRHSGTGLGLAISRRLACAMGGDIVARSCPGRGSTFTAVVRLKTAQSPEHPRAAKPSTHHVLLALRNGVERTALRLTLEGAEVPAVDADPAAVDAVAQAALDVDAALTAVVADARDGLMAATVALAAAKRAAAGPVRGIVLLDPTQQKDFSSYRAAGFERFLVRPVRPRSLLEQLAETVPQRTSVKRNASAPSQIGPLEVLLVEDNEINALLATRMLEKYGATVHRVSNGQDAVSAIRHHIAGAAEYDLVLMDVHMPVMDGLEAARQIQTLFAASGASGAKRPAIVALTANAFPEDRERCRAAGMDDYLAKPFDREELEHVITRARGTIAR